MCWCWRSTLLVEDLPCCGGRGAEGGVAELWRVPVYRDGRAVVGCLQSFPAYRDERAAELR